ncbi:MAG: hypothetical protein M3305_07630, partial [Actinomycetota bacterium]|nr:hypothetical protein [Actinomycetota bacterium]
MRADQSKSLPMRAPHRLSVVGWATYDLATRIFVMSMSLYFSQWVVNDMGGTDLHWALASSLPTAVLFFSAPFLGALSDQAARRMPFLISTTLVAVICTLLLGLGGLTLSLVLFAIGYTFFQAAMIFYDSLLPIVSTAETRGRVGGLGIGLGYLGSFIVVVVGIIVLSADPENEPLLFRLTALLFLIFSLPCFLFVREPAKRAAQVG